MILFLLFSIVRRTTQSSSLFPVPGSPNAPVVVNVTSNSVELEWSLDTEENLGLPIEAYNIEQWRLGDSVWRNVASRKIGESHYFENVIALYLDVRVDAGSIVQGGTFELEIVGEALISQSPASRNARVTWPIAYDANGGSIQAALEALDGIESVRAWRCDAVRGGTAGWLAGCAYANRGGYSWKVELETTSSLQVPIAVYRHTLDGVWTGPGPMVLVRQGDLSSTHRFECGVTEWIGNQRHATPHFPKCLISVIQLLPNSIYAFRLVAVSAVGASAPGPASRYAQTLHSVQFSRPSTPSAPLLIGDGESLLFHVATPFSMSSGDRQKGTVIDYYELQSRQADDNIWSDAGIARLDASGFATARLKSGTNALRSRAVSEKYQLRSDWSIPGLVSSSSIRLQVNQISISAEALESEPAILLRWLPASRIDQSYEIAWQREGSVSWQLNADNVSSVKMPAIHDEIQIIESRVAVYEAGGFRLAFDGRATSKLSWDASPNEVVSALAQTSFLSKEKIYVTRRTASRYDDSVLIWRVTFIDALSQRSAPFPLLTVYSTSSSKHNAISVQRVVAAVPAVIADVLETVVKNLQPLTRYRFRARTTNNIWSEPSSWVRTGAMPLKHDTTSALGPARELVLQAASGYEAARNSDPDYALGVGIGGKDGSDGTDGAVVLSIYDDDGRHQAKAVYLEATRTSRRYVVPTLGSHRGTTLRLVAKLWGAGGGASTLTIPPGSSIENVSTFGGGGGFAQASFSVVSGQVLEVLVGKGGKGTISDAPGIGGERGGNNGGRAEDRAGGGGGGLSSIRRSETLLLVAGAGGGSGSLVINSACMPNGGGGGGANALCCAMDKEEEKVAAEQFIRNEEGVSVPLLSSKDDYVSVATKGSLGNAGRGGSGFTSAGGGGGSGWPGGNGGAPGCGGNGGHSYVDDSRLSVLGLDDEMSLVAAPTVLNVDHSSVRLAVNSQPSSVMTNEQYEIEMARQSISMAFDRVALSVSTSVSIDSLEPETSYIFRSRRVNRSWISEPSESITVTTLAAPIDKWVRINTRGNAPSGRRGHSLTRLSSYNASVFSSLDQSLVILFGGFGDGYECDAPLGATFRMGSPSAGRDVRPCFLRGGASNELWLLDTALWSWSQLIPDANQSWPSPRAYHVAADINGRLLIWGGRVDADPPASADAEPEHLVDLWELDLLRRPRRIGFDWNNATENRTTLGITPSYFSIQVSDLSDQCIRDVDVALHLSCDSSSSRFVIDLIGPNDNQIDSSGKPISISVPLVGRRTSGSTFENAACDGEILFDDEAGSMSKKPLGKLSRFHHVLPNGMWTLRIRNEDLSFRERRNVSNSARLLAWRLEMLIEPCERKGVWTNLSATSSGDAPPWLLDPVGTVVNTSLFVSGRRANDVIGDAMPLWRYDRSSQVWIQLLASSVNTINGRSAVLTPYGLFAFGGVLRDGLDGRLLRAADLRKSRWETHFVARASAVLPADYRLDGTVLRENRFLQATLASIHAPRPRAYSALTYVEAGVANKLEYKYPPPTLLLYGGDDDTTILDDLWRFELSKTSSFHKDTNHAALCDWRFIQGGGAQQTWEMSCGSTSSSVSDCSLSDLIIRAFCLNQSQSLQSLDPHSLNLLR